VRSEGLLDDAVSSHSRTPLLVVRLEITAHQEHRHVAQTRRGLHEFADFVPIFARHGNVGKDENRLHRWQLLDGCDTVRDCLNLEAVVLKNPLGLPLDNRAIVRDEDQSSHATSVSLLYRQMTRETNITRGGGSQEKQESGVRIQESE
jgi:hypothetical protein